MRILEGPYTHRPRSWSIGPTAIVICLGIIVGVVAGVGVGYVAALLQ